MKYFQETAQVYFETIKCDDYEVFNLDYHTQRVSNTLALNINLGEYIYPPNNKLLRCKLIYDDEITYSKKYLNRDSLDKNFEKKENAHEIIIVKNGFITDTSIANIAIYLNNIWITPKKPLLLGTTRARYLKEGKIIEKDISVDDLQKASKIALMNAMIDFDILEDYSLFL